LPTGIGGLTKISTGLGTCTAKSNSPAVSIGVCWKNLCDLLTGSTESHPRPDIAISQAGLHKNKNKKSHIYELIINIAIFARNDLTMKSRIS
jgi:hypothetical protein